MRALLTSTLAVCLSSSIGLAAPAKSIAKSKKSAKSSGDAAEVTSTNLDDTSAAVRTRKSGHASFRGGNVVGGFEGYGGEGQYYFTPSLHFGGFFVTGSHDFTDDLESTVEDNDVKTTEALMTFTLTVAQARYFVGNSFFVDGGLGVRTFASRFAFEQEEAGSFAVTTKATSIVAQVGIGNLWSFDNGLLIGAEWIGYNQPISSSFSASSETEGAVTDSIEDVQALAKELAQFTAETGAAMALFFNVGYAF